MLLKLASQLAGRVFLHNMDYFIQGKKNQETVRELTRLGLLPVDFGTYLDNDSKEEQGPGREAEEMLKNGPYYLPTD